LRHAPLHFDAHSQGLRCPIWTNPLLKCCCTSAPHWFANRLTASGCIIAEIHFPAAQTGLLVPHRATLICRFLPAGGVALEGHAECCCPSTPRWAAWRLCGPRYSVPARDALRAQLLLLLLTIWVAETQQTATVLLPAGALPARRAAVVSAPRSPAYGLAAVSQWPRQNRLALRLLPLRVLLCVGNAISDCGVPPTMLLRTECCCPSEPGYQMTARSFLRSL
jgi:hypothetical protein